MPSPEDGIPQHPIPTLPCLLILSAFSPAVLQCSAGGGVNIDIPLRAGCSLSVFYLLVHLSTEYNPLQKKPVWPKGRVARYSRRQFDRIFERQLGYVFCLVLFFN